MEVDFDNVITNIGGAYSRNTGTFTCPKVGVYVFAWTVHASTRYIDTQLVRNGALVGETMAGDSNTYSGIGTGVVVVQLSQGDEVWVRIAEFYPATTVIRGDIRATEFSGFILR